MMNKKAQTARKPQSGIPSDVLGSYTGEPLAPTETPVQDADDL